MQFYKKHQSAIIVLIAILILAIGAIGCVTNTSKPSDSVSPPNLLNSPLELTDNNIASALNNNTFIVLDFYYPGCGPCKLMNRTISQLSEELQGQIAFGRMNVRERENRETVKKYKISAYPTLLFFDEGILVSRMRGNKSKSDLLVELKDLKPGLDTSKVDTAVTAQAATRSKMTQEQACKNMTKSAIPVLEAFVVSHCPFGLQMQRIMAEIIRELPQSKDYLKVRYIGSIANGTVTSMHGNEEAQENLRQICIREEQTDKYWDYVSCYMKEGKSAECLKLLSIDMNKLDSCSNDSTLGLAYSWEDFDLANKFNITGSPTLTLNDKIVSEFDFASNTTSGRSPEALKELLCCGFSVQPSFCTQKLNTTPAITNFQVKAPTKSPGKIIPLIKPGLNNPAKVMLITDNTMNSAVSQYQLLVVVGFTDYCIHCKRFNVTISELASELQGQAAFGLIDRQKNNETKATYNITAIPVSLIFKDGELADRVLGNKNKSTFLTKLKEIEPTLNTSKMNTTGTAVTPNAQLQLQDTS